MSAASLELGLQAVTGFGWIAQGGQGPDLLDHEKVEEIHIRAGFNDGDDLCEATGYFLDLAFFRAEPEAGGMYSSSIQAHLGLDQIRLLHEFLGFLIANPRKFEEPA